MDTSIKLDGCCRLRRRSEWPALRHSSSISRFTSSTTWSLSLIGSDLRFSILQKNEALTLARTRSAHILWAGPPDSVGRYWGERSHSKRFRVSRAARAGDAYETSAPCNG